MTAVAVPRGIVNGVLLLDKPRGLTSQQAVAHVKRIYQARKAGHTGTLDPMADGLLPIGLGEATKFSQFLLEADKQYLATLQLGTTTTTGDAEGDTVSRRAVQIRLDDVQETLVRFVGLQAQVPPMHSALKVAGKPLYVYARAGVSIEREPRVISIKSIQLIDLIDKYMSIRVLCSKGTYIRTLAEDIGAAIGCGAHLSALTRERAGGFSLRDAISLDALAALAPGRRGDRLLPVDVFAISLPRHELDATSAGLLINGRRIASAVLPETGVYRLYSPAGTFLGIGEVRDAVLQARRLIGQTGNADGSPNGLSNQLVSG